jgi:hypothetical protein
MSLKIYAFTTSARAINIFAMLQNALRKDPGRGLYRSDDVPSSPTARLQFVRDYATQVFGKELTAAAWLGQLSPEVLDGACIVATACQTETGFRQAMQYLARLDRLRRAGTT